MWMCFIGSGLKRGFRNVALRFSRRAQLYYFDVRACHLQADLGRNRGAVPANVPSEPRQILKDIPRPPNSASRDDERSAVIGGRSPVAPSPRPGPADSQIGLGSLACLCHAIHVTIGIKLDPISAFHKSRFSLSSQCRTVTGQRRRWIYVWLGENFRSKYGRKSNSESDSKSICAGHILSPDVS
jgi:hypothetical protein